MGYGLTDHSLVQSAQVFRRAVDDRDKLYQRQIYGEAPDGPLVRTSLAGLNASTNVMKLREFRLKGNILIADCGVLIAECRRADPHGRKNFS